MHRLQRLGVSFRLGMGDFGIQGAARLFRQGIGVGARADQGGFVGCLRSLCFLACLAGLGFQAIWAAVLLAFCAGVLRAATRKVVVQGG